MNKKEAIEVMKQGLKVTHRWFSPDEWMTIKDGRYEFEDGCLCEFEEFWYHRPEDTWSEGWKLF